MYTVILDKQSLIFYVYCPIYAKQFKLKSRKTHNIKRERKGFKPRTADSLMIFDIEAAKEQLKQP